MGGVVRGDETDIAVRRTGDGGGGGGGHVRGDDGGFCAEPAAPGFGTMDSAARSDSGAGGGLEDGFVATTINSARHPK